VLSMPEYVAGLQFETVIIMDVNNDLAGDDVLTLRRFVSWLYLGMRRAHERLVLHCTANAGSISQQLRVSMENGWLVKRISS